MVNKEILFRGISVETKQFVEGDLLQKYIHHQGFLTIIQDGCIYNKIIPETLGQFAGLSDKNETKIFEGDRVKCINPSDGLTDLGEVVMSGLGCWSIRVNGLIVPLFEYIEYPLSIVHDFKRIEIIGTIHDHLLKGR